MKKHDVYKVLIISFICICTIILTTAVAVAYIINTKKVNMNMIKPTIVVHAETLNNTTVRAVYEVKKQHITCEESETLVTELFEPETEKETAEPETTTPEIIEPVVVPRTYPYTDYEIYELAKIIMCEAEGESQRCKEYIGQVIINRTKHDDFPDTIHDVIFERNQFTPTFDGRWEIIEPDENSYNAAYTVINAPEPITEALWFEACSYSSWHSRNLTKIDQIDETRFYIE